MRRVIHRLIREQARSYRDENPLPRAARIESQTGRTFFNRDAAIKFEPSTTITDLTTRFATGATGWSGKTTSCEWAFHGIAASVPAFMRVADS